MAIVGGQVLVWHFLNSWCFVSINIYLGMDCQGYICRYGWLWGKALDKLLCRDQVVLKCRWNSTVNWQCSTLLRRVLWSPAWRCTRLAVIAKQKHTMTTCYIFKKNMVLIQIWIFKRWYFGSTPAPVMAISPSGGTHLLGQEVLFAGIPCKGTCHQGVMGNRVVYFWH